MKEEDLLNKLNDLKGAAFSGALPDISYLNQIKKELFNVDKKDREKLKPFVAELKQKLFENNIRIKGLDFEKYFLEVDKKESNEFDVESNDKVSISVNKEIVELKFDDLLKKLLQCIQETLFSLKGYAILKLSNRDLKNFKIKVLYDENYYYSPIESKITKEFDECDASSIKDFEKFLEEDNIPENNLLCLVLLTSKINNKEALLSTQNSLKNIFDSFDDFEYCSLKDSIDLKGDFYKRGIDKDDFFEELRFITEKFLSNGKISFEEEKIIKKVFATSSAPVLTYKLLKAGNSGAKVIEIKQIQPFTSEQYERRFIVKFSKKDSNRKLRLESQRFTDFIDSYDGFDEYSCTLYESAAFEALLYRFAKSGNAIHSYPFAEIIDNEDNIFHSLMVNQIEKLFNLQLLTHWKGSMKKEKILINDLYEDYVNLEKIQTEVLKIRNITETEFKSEQFYINLNKLLNFEIEVNNKVCHGDLHTENFFIDDKGELFLIDFGYTGIKHSLVDHTSLECSIKFNHIPNYIELETLLKIERELHSDSTFDFSYNFREANRKDLLKYYNCIKQIRLDSNKYFLNTESKIEYNISLFFMSYRQVAYKDMNQLFALKSSEILLEKIIVDLGL